MFKALVLLDEEQLNYSLDLVEVASQLAGEEEVALYGLGINLSNKELKGLDYLLTIETQESLKDSRIVAELIQQVQTTYQFDTIIILATDFGRMVAPRLAMKLEVGLVADITAIEVDEKGRKLIRPAFAGNMLASIVCDSTPIMASVHPNVFHPELLTKEPKVITFCPDEMKASTIEIIKIENQPELKDIREAKVLVSAGAGYETEIENLVPLAKQLAGLVSVSKEVVERGKAPREIQVGQSGKTVSPDLYISLGIYGSMQHVEGLKKVKHLISVNTDKGAPMNYLADLTVIGDAATFVEKLTMRLKK
ncbi:electron transfer flavoprotein subunit alpha/FixB family protein [Enterococcus sp. AZ103]|uniref:electron transfer flavoprotein subunit alpha/FixB family protein n=1 Tax=Enterococcus sp. AZ103 TaxID=2774628 RepID=UPI003F22C117